MHFVEKNEISLYCNQACIVAYVLNQTCEQSPFFFFIDE